MTGEGVKFSFGSSAISDTTIQIVICTLANLKRLGLVKPTTSWNLI
jgi:hypothetical protein